MAKPKSKPNKSAEAVVRIWWDPNQPNYIYESSCTPDLVRFTTWSSSDTSKYYEPVHFNRNADWLASIGKPAPKHRCTIAQIAEWQRRRTAAPVAI